MHRQSDDFCYNIYKMKPWSFDTKKEMANFLWASNDKKKMSLSKMTRQKVIFICNSDLKLLYFELRFIQQ